MQMPFLRVVRTNIDISHPHRRSQFRADMSVKVGNHCRCISAETIPDLDAFPCDFPELFVHRKNYPFELQSAYIRKLRVSEDNM
jgi:hypothetical protein